MRRLTRHHLRQLARAVVTALLVSIPFVALAVLVQERFHPLIDLDQHLVLRATDVTRRHPGLRSALVVWQEVWQPWRAYIAASLLCLWTWLGKGMRTRSLWAWVTMMLGWNLFLQAKLVVQRARPVIDDPVSHAPGYSFPSGHAANTTAICLVVVLLLWPLLRPRAARAVAVVVAALVALSILLDRVFLGVHYPSDVTAGALLAGALVYGSWHGFVRVPRDRRPPLHPSDPTDPSTPSAPTTRRA